MNTFWRHNEVENNEMLDRSSESKSIIRPTRLRKPLSNSFTWSANYFDFSYLSRFLLHLNPFLFQTCYWIVVGADLNKKSLCLFVLVSASFNWFCFNKKRSLLSVYRACEIHKMHFSSFVVADFIVRQYNCYQMLQTCLFGLILLSICSLNTTKQYLEKDNIVFKLRLQRTLKKGRLYKVY